MAEEKDYSEYRDKPPTPLQDRFVPWLIEKVGVNPATMKTKQDAFAEGVRLAVSLRIPFQASPENRAATEELRTQREEEMAALRAAREEERAKAKAEREEAAAASAAAREEAKAAKAAKAAAKPVVAQDEEATVAPATPAKSAKPAKTARARAATSRSAAF